MPVRRPSLPAKSAAIIARLAEDVASLSAKVEWLTGLAFAAIARQADLEAPGPTIKALSIDTNYSPSTIRKWAHARPEGERFVRRGGRVYLIEEALPPKVAEGRGITAIWRFCRCVFPISIRTRSPV